MSWDIVWMALLTVFAASITFSSLVPRMLSMPVLTDIVSSGFFLSVYAGSGAQRGLEIAIMAIVIVSVTIRLWRGLFGYQRLTVDNDPDPSRVVAHLITGAAFWLRLAFRAIFLGSSNHELQLFNFNWEFRPGLLTPLIKRIKSWLNTVFSITTENQR